MSEHLPESAQTYWRWGLPSVLLAIVSILVFAWSVLWVEPRVDNRYQGLILAGLGDVRQGRIVREGESLRECVDRLRRLELAANRLIVRYPGEARYRRWSAELGLGIERGIRASMREQVQVGEKVERVGGRGVDRGLSKSGDEGEFESVAVMERGRAEDAIRSAMRLEGEDAQWARGWVLRQQLGRVGTRSDLGLSDVQQMLRRLEEFGDLAWVQSARGRLEVQVGHSAVEEQEQTRREWLEMGVNRLRDGFSSVEVREVSQFIDRVWVAEGLGSLEVGGGREEAREAIVQGAGLMKREPEGLDEAQRGELVDSFFRALVMVSGLSEGGVAVLSRLDGFSVDGKRELIDRIVASHFRMMQSGRLFPRGGFGGIGVGDWYRSAMRFRVDHPQVEGGLDSYFRGEGDLEGAELIGSRGDRLLATLGWMREGIRVGAVEEGMEWDESDADILVGLMRYLLGRVRRGGLEWEKVRSVVDGMVAGMPRVVELRLGRGLLARECRVWEVALEDFRVLKDRGVQVVGLEELFQEARREVEGKVEGP